MQTLCAERPDHSRGVGLPFHRQLRQEILLMICMPSESRTASATLKAHADFATSPSFLTSPIAARSGTRPRTESCLPHAQTEAESPDDVFELLKVAATERLGSTARTDRTTVSVPSTWPAFHLCMPCASDIMPHEACMTPGGPSRGLEFAHIHAAYIPDDHPVAVAARRQRAPWQAYQGGGQGSMHLCLTLRDAAAALDAGWGELHLLAGQQMGPGMSAPRGLVLIYAPRDASEIAVVVDILAASHAFSMSGKS